MDLILEAGAPKTFHILTLIIFILAILHTLFANHFVSLANHVEAVYARNPRKEKKQATRIRFIAEMLRFLGEIEIVFALWAIPLVIVILSFYDWKTVLNYLDSRVYEEPFFIVIVMSLASTRPIFQLAEKGVHFLAKWLGDTPGAWWLVVMTLSPPLGSIISEAAAITIGALILKKRFYHCGVSKKLAYATLGLMFVNFSVGGMLTNLAAPPSLILSSCYKWSAADFFQQFGLKTLVGILGVNLAYFFFFRKEFSALKKKKPEPVAKEEPVPLWITCAHLLFISWVIYMKEYSPVFTGTYLLFLGFHHATRPYQSPVSIRQPLMVGLFLIGLIMHTEFQKWWIEELLTGLNYEQMMLTGVVVTAFTENSIVAQLACLIPDLTPLLKYALVSGFIAGGGLTVIAHAPNLVGQTILKRYFRKGVSPLYLFLGALGPTLVFVAIYYLFPPN